MMRDVEIFPPSCHHKTETETGGGSDIIEKQVRNKATPSIFKIAHTVTIHTRNVETLVLLKTSCFDVPEEKICQTALWSDMDYYLKHECDIIGVQQRIWIVCAAFKKDPSPCLSDYGLCLGEYSFPKELMPTSVIRETPGLL